MHAAETVKTAPASELTDAAILAERRGELADACRFVLVGAMPPSLDEAQRADRARTLLAELLRRQG